MNNNSYKKVEKIETANLYLKKDSEPKNLKKDSKFNNVFKKSLKKVDTQEEYIHTPNSENKVTIKRK